MWNACWLRSPRKNVGQGSPCGGLQSASDLLRQRPRVHVVGDAGDAIALGHQRRPAVAISDAVGVSHHRRRLAVGPFEEVDLADGLPRLHRFPEIDAVLVEPGLRREAIVVAVERLHPARRLQAHVGRVFSLPAQHAEVDQHVAQPALA